jgi:hypothetical protein
MGKSVGDFRQQRDLLKMGKVTAQPKRTTYSFLGDDEEVRLLLMAR